LNNFWFDKGDWCIDRDMREAASSENGLQSYVSEFANLTMTSKWPRMLLRVSKTGE